MKIAHIDLGKHPILLAYQAESRIGYILHRGK